MDLIDFLRSLVPDNEAGVAAAGAVGGALLFGAIELLDKLYTLSGNVKRALALAGCVVIPALAYAVRIQLGDVQLTPNGAFLVLCVVVGLVAKVLHDVTEHKT